MVVGGRDKKGRKKERKRRKGFWKVAFLFLSSFFVCFLKVFSTFDFGPNLVVFFVFRGFDYFRILKIFNCDFFGRWEESGFVVIRVRVQVQVCSLQCTNLQRPLIHICNQRS